MVTLVVEPYTQHDWGNLIWALLLAVLGTVLVIDMALFLVMAHRTKAVPSLRTPRRHRHA